LQIPILPARTGRLWVKNSFRLLRRAPAPLTMATLVYLVVLVLSTALPWVGPLAPLLLGPALSVGLMQAMRLAAQGIAPSAALPVTALRPLPRQQLKALAGLGLVNAAGTALALAASALIDQGLLSDLASGQIDSTDPRLRDGSLLASLALSMLIYTPVQMALWFAPLFVAWHGQPVGKALFFSLVAVMRNKWAFMQYGLAWMAVALAASLLVQVVMILFGHSALMMSILMTPVSLVIITAVYGSVWESYRDSVAVDSKDSVSPADS
jgi:hypothetical protein